jgi:hypothetical protein
MLGQFSCEDECLPVHRKTIRPLLQGFLDVDWDGGQADLQEQQHIKEFPPL